VTPLIQFAYLQALDILTTLVFLGQGVEEANPLVRMALAVSRNPLTALLAIKAAAVAMAVYCRWSGRSRVLAGANAFFAALVVWNLLALLAKAPA
jgi:hypothetical protein